MATPIPFHLFLLTSLLVARSLYGSTFSFDLHHRFSDKVRDWTQSLSPNDAAQWPGEGTPEYYTSLVAHDRALLRRRQLQGAPRYQNLTFAEGNLTVKFPRLGRLHYGAISLGTPNRTFLLALDTGSNLMWVPCDCTDCVSHPKNRFPAFNSSASETSERVTCSSSLCDDEAHKCSSPNDTCPYVLEYLDGSSTSGVLLEDVMHFTTDGGEAKPVQTRVTFGCGQNQGNEALPTGLLGLGQRDISVPTTLARAGLTSNSFSMCFSPDGSGRISFGDEVTQSQHVTPANSTIGIYGVTVKDVLMNGSSLNTGFHAYLDTGSSFTILEDPFYSIFVQKYDGLVSRERIFPPHVPFEYCYLHGSNRGALPVTSLVMEGGGVFHVYEQEARLVQRSTRRPVGFCLAIIKSKGINIIGQNFLIGQKLVFDGERQVIGWTQFDCYNNVAPEDLSPGTAPTRFIRLQPVAGSVSYLLRLPANRSFLLLHSFSFLLTIIFSILIIVYGVLQRFYI